MPWEECCRVLLWQGRPGTPHGFAPPAPLTNPAVPRRAAEALFAEFDADGDGELSFEEFQAFPEMYTTADRS